MSLMKGIFIKMKKILSVVLLVSCLVLLCSCAFVNKAKRAVGLGPKVSDFEEAIANTDASSVLIDVTSNTALGTLKTRFEVYFRDDSSAVIKYSYEKFNPIEVGEDDEIKSTVSGTVTRSADGVYSEDIGVDLSAVTAAVALDLSSFGKEAYINDAGDVLEVKVPKEKTADVFGVDFGKDVKLKITLNGEAVRFVELSYDGGSAYYQYAN